MCRVLFCILIFSSLSFNKLYGANIFHIDILDDKITVASPDRYHPDLHILFYNRGTGRAVGKLQTVHKRVIAYISLKKGESRSLPIAHIAKEKIYYYSLHPPFQEVELSIGKLYYEIPEKE